MEFTGENDRLTDLGTAGLEIGMLAEEFRERLNSRAAAADASQGQVRLKPPAFARESEFSHRSLDPFGQFGQSLRAGAHRPTKRRRDV